MRVTQIKEGGAVKKWGVIERIPVKDIDEGTNLINKLMKSDPLLSVTLMQKRDDGHAD